MSERDIDELKRFITDELQPIKDKVDPMYEAYVTVKNGSTWIRYAFWFIGSIAAGLFALKEIFKK